MFKTLMISSLVFSTSAWSAVPALNCQGILNPASAMGAATLSIDAGGAVKLVVNTIERSGVVTYAPGNYTYDLGESPIRMTGNLSVKPVLGQPNQVALALSTLNQTTSGLFICDPVKAAFE